VAAVWFPFSFSLLPPFTGCFYSMGVNIGELRG